MNLNLNALKKKRNKKHLEPHSKKCLNYNSISLLTIAVIQYVQ